MSDEALRALLDTHRQNLEKSELQAASHGFLNVPLHLANQIDHTRSTIKSIQAELHQRALIRSVPPEKSSLTNTKSRKVWDENAFFDDARVKLDLQSVNSLRRLYTFSQQWADKMTWGTSPNKGSFNPKANTVHPGKSLYTVYSDGCLELNFQWLRDYEPAIPLVETFAGKLRAANIFPIPSDAAQRNVRVSPEQWLARVEAFIDVVGEIILPNQGSKRLEHT